MDFFAQQEAARRATAKLVAAFALAVATIVAVVYLAARVLLFDFVAAARQPAGEPFPTGLWIPELFALVAALTLGVVFIGSLYRVATLRQGGAAVAELLGGRPVEPNTADPDERRLVNVVEEMAIAAGTPAPSVWLLDNEPAVNAFAAGFGPEDAIIGVTKGALKLLTRDQLQGVVAHELGHIVAGDTRLNLRLMGLLHGILVIALIGRFAVRLSFHSTGSSRRRGPVPVTIAFGAALMAIGWIGVLCGRMIKSAVSRQREYLADASAVQFTRNPPGLAGALKTIGGLARGSRLDTAHAEEASHMVFANGLRPAILPFFATHPPLVARIQRIDPSFDGRFPAVDLPAELAPPTPVRVKVAAPPPTAPPAAGVDPEALVARAGSVVRGHLDWARRLLAALPGELREQLHEPSAAQAVVFALLLAREPAARERQRSALAAAVGPELLAETERLAPFLADCPHEARLPLVDLAVPALTRLSPRQYRAFRRAVEELIAGDEEIDLFETALGWIILRHLGPRFGERRPGVVQYYSLRRLGEECSVLLTALARSGGGDDEAVARSLAAGAALLADESVAIELLPEERSSLDAVRAALERLALLAPTRKRPLLAAATAAVAADHRVTAREAELVRAVAEALECPLPPLTAAG